MASMGSFNQLVMMVGEQMAEVVEGERFTHDRCWTVGERNKER